LIESHSKITRSAPRNAAMPDANTQTSERQSLRHIEIVTRRVVNEVVAGRYHSVFRGRGMEFDEVREYIPGDDVRSIDWNVTARTGRPHIKRYVEERELTVMLCVDLSASTDFGSVGRLKRMLATEVSALLAFSAIKNNDRVGLMLFADEVEKFIAPKKGRNHVLRVIRELLHRSRGRGTNIPGALEHLNNVVRRRSVVFLLSDFAVEGDLHKPLSIANHRHDLVALTVTDPREVELPNVGLVELEDAETGRRRWIDTSSRRVRNGFAEEARRRLLARERLFQSLSIDHVDLWTDRDYVMPLVEFFRRRAGRN